MMLCICSVNMVEKLTVSSMPEALRGYRGSGYEDVCHESRAGYRGRELYED